MLTTDSTKWKVLGAAVVIFVLGFAAGALSLNLYHRHGPRDDDDQRRARFEQALKQLNLDADQQKRVDTVVNDTREKFEEIHKESHERFEDVRKQSRDQMQKILTPDQWQKLQAGMKNR
jgi:Spy/CpxP family protein refolding chaperone